MSLYLRFIFILSFIVNVSFLGAQEIRIDLGPSKVAKNEIWKITVTVFDGKLDSYSSFPVIEGFQSRGISSSSTTKIINGKIFSSHSVVMNYLPLKEGRVLVRAFSMKVNGRIVESKGKNVMIGPAASQSSRGHSFHNLFGNSPFDVFRDDETEFVDIAEDAFFALTTNKEEIYVGEGVTTNLSFYVADDNKAPMDFFEIGDQLSDILKKIRPKNCWEENFNVENIQAEPVEIRSKRYRRFKIYEGVFYPLNGDWIKFPSVGLKMIKYKVAKNPSFFSQNRKQDYKTFYSRPKTVRVKELPYHPLKDLVSVGEFNLKENIDTKLISTGQSFSYSFSIFGEGNITSINKPSVLSDNVMDVFAPSITERISRELGVVSGSKAFNYYVIPREPGEYDLGNYFNWVFFNPNEEKYDTLRSEILIEVVGDSKKNESIQSNDLGGFYTKVDLVDNELVSLTTAGWRIVLVNAVLLLIGVMSVYVWFKK